MEDHQEGEKHTREFLNSLWTAVLFLIVVVLAIRVVGQFKDLPRLDPNPPAQAVISFPAEYRLEEPSSTTEVPPITAVVESQREEFATVNGVPSMVTFLTSGQVVTLTKLPVECLSGCNITQINGSAMIVGALSGGTYSQ